MTIATPEDLEAVPVDTEVDVRDSGIWKRVEGGLVKDGTTLELHHFKGAVAAGLVSSRTAEPVTVGTVFHSPRYRDPIRFMWVVLRVRDDGSLDVASIQSHRFHQLTHWEAAYPTLRNYIRTPIGDQPNYVQIVVAMGTLLLQWQQEEGAKVPAPLLRELHALAGEYIEEEDDHTLDDLLNQHGVGRTAPHTMTVVMRGTVQTDVIRTAIGSPNMDLAVVSPQWTLAVTIVREGAGCLCGTVTREELDAQVPAASNADWTFTVSH